MIDLHSHILFGIDDGAETVEDSLDMLKQACNAGVKGIACSPHVVEQGFETLKSENLKVLDQLKDLCKKENINIELYSNCENYLSEFLFKDDYFEKYGLTINNSDYLLIELPMIFLPPDYRLLLDQIRKKGYRVIIAHPERNQVIIKDPEIVYRLVNSGYIMQLDARSYLYPKDSPIFKCCQTLLDANLIHCVSSDAHSAGKKHYEKFLDSFNKIKEDYGEKTADILFSKNPEKIINNQEIERFPAKLPTERKNGILNKLLSIFKK